MHFYIYGNPLYSVQAVILGNLDKVKEIVQDIKKHSCDYLIDLASEEDGYNMLHFAVCYKRKKIVRFLIDNGASELSSHTTYTYL